MAISRRKKITIVSIIVAILIIYPSASYGISTYYDIKVVKMNNQFLSTRLNLSNANSFGYNASLRQYYQFNVTVPGVGPVDMAVLSESSVTLPYYDLNLTHQIGNHTDFPALQLSLVFLNVSNSFLDRLGFTAWSISINSSDFELPVINNTNIIVRDLDQVNSIPNSGPSFFIAGGFVNPIKLGIVPSGYYYAHVTLGFYDIYLGIPISVKSYTFSLPYLEISWA